MRKSNLRSTGRLIALFTLITLSGTAWAQSLQETFDWMTSTLQPSERNNGYVHRPNERPYPRTWVEKNIDPYHTETIESFSHDACRVTVVVSMIDNSMWTLLGKTFYEKDTDTFDLSTIDPKTIKITDACAPVETSSGKIAPMNCEDEVGLQMEFKSRNAKPTIHREILESSTESPYGVWQETHDPEHSLSRLCKDIPKNSAYCDEPEHKEKPEDLTSSNLVFHSPEYTKRFIEAFRHAVELCGGKPSAF